MQQILNRDEDFFLNSNYKQDNHNDNLIIIKKLKDYWKNINNNNRETIWKYLEVIITLSSKT